MNTRREHSVHVVLLALMVSSSALSSVHAQDAQTPPLAYEATSCVMCHSDSDPRNMPPSAHDPVEHFEQDVHRAAGLSCHDCHGGAPEVDVDAPDAKDLAHAASAGFRGRPAPQDVPAFCGRCHSDAAYMSRFDPDVRVDQEQLYATSVHGQKLAEGDVKVANCISCHGRHPGGEMASALAHGITAISDPNGPVHPTQVATTCGRCHSDAAYMKEYGIPTDQQALYERSVHHTQLVEKEDLSAPTCNDCHGNHGARPPGVADLAFVCGTCHGRQAELFRESTMATVFEMNELGECMVCHGNHLIVPPSDAMLVSQGDGDPNEVQRCSDCHTGSDDTGAPIGKAMHDGILALDDKVHGAEEVLADAEAKGMPVSEAEFHLTGATDALIEARVAIHRFDPALVEEPVARGSKVAEEAHAMGEAAIADFYFRHRWLAISLVGIAFVIVSLVLKVRQVDRRLEARRATSGGRDAPA
ncbi:MAG: hypothetical protein H6825_11285 [Planctomycetes bacterium]|nr:hypothetical protein [Planctomycetota bacterium]